MRIAKELTFAMVLAATAWAQSSGSFRGRVVDESGQPIEGVEILIEYTERVTRERSIVTDDRGSFVQIGLEPGYYRLTFRKEGFQPLVFEEQATLGPPTELGERVLKKMPEAVVGGGGGPEAAARGVFDDALEAAERENYPAAIEAFQKYLEEDPDSAEAHFNLAYSYAKTGDGESAIRHYERAVELRPDYREAYVALGDVASASREWSKATEAYGKAVELGASEASTLFNYGAAAMNGGNMAKAQEAFQKLLEVDPDHAGGHYQLGMVLVGQAKNEEAIAHLEKYLELEPNGANAATASAILEHLRKN